MNETLTQLKEELKDAYDYFIVPKAVLDAPVELSKMQKEDGSYYTINELSDLLGKDFTPTTTIDNRFMKFRWAIPRNGEEALIVTYLLSKGLVNMRDNGIDDALDYTVDEIDFTALQGNEFSVFGMHEIKKVPNPPMEEELI